MPAKSELGRLPAVDESTNPEAAAVFAEIKKTRGNVSHVLRSLAHAPQGLRAFAGYGEYVRYRTTLSGRVRELTILALACGNQYAWTHHVPFALKEGSTAEQIAASVDADPEDVYHCLTHLSANGEAQISLGATPAEDNFSL